MFRTRNAELVKQVSTRLNLTESSIEDCNINSIGLKADENGLLLNERLRLRISDT